MRGPLRFFKANIANIIGIIFAISLFVAGKKVAYHFKKRKIEKMKILLDNMTGKYGVIQLDETAFSMVSKADFLSRNLFHIRKEIESGNHGKLNEENKKTFLDLLKKLKYVNSPLEYDAVCEEANKMDVTLRDLQLNILKKSGLINDGIFSTAKLAMFGFPKNILEVSMQYSRIYLEQLKKKGFNPCLNIKHRCFSPKKLTLSPEESLKKLERIDRNSLDAAFEELWEICFRHHECVINTKKIESSWASRATRILIPVAAVCAGFVAKKTISCCMSK